MIKQLDIQLYKNSRCRRTASTLKPYECRWGGALGSPYLNRFLQLDNIIPNRVNPQSWNRFSYVTNNPLKYSDPTGHVRTDEAGGGWTTSCDTKLKKSDPCPEGTTDSRDMTDWIVRALPDSANHSTIRMIRKVNKGDLGFGEVVTRSRTHAGARTRIWFINLVKGGGYFDIKQNMRSTIGPGEPIKLGNNWYDYSTAGNMMYGYYGAAAGYSLSELHAGAGAAQMLDAAKYKHPDYIGSPLNSFDSEQDYYAIEFGYKLYYLAQEKGGLTVEDFTTALENYEHRDKLAIKPPPSKCIPATRKYRTDEFYIK